MSSPDGFFYASPGSEKVRLDIRPRLASWDAAEHPNQAALKAFLDHADELLAAPLSNLAGPLAIRLDVGLPQVTNLLHTHDLDNYAYPLAKSLTAVTDRRIVSVWCAKSQDDASTIAVADAEGVPRPTFGRLIEARTSASTDTVAYKQQIHDQVPRTAILPAGSITMQIAFTVSPKRNWVHLWKPTIDSLDALLGRTAPTRDWHPLDGRIVELGLHCTYDPTLGNDVGLVIGASSVGV